MSRSNEHVIYSGTVNAFEHGSEALNCSRSQASLNLNFLCLTDRSGTLSSAVSREPDSRNVCCSQWPGRHIGSICRHCAGPLALLTHVRLFNSRKSSEGSICHFTYDCDIVSPDIHTLATQCTLPEQEEGR